MGTWNSRGLRGSTLEDFINRTNERYQQQGLALIQKIPTTDHSGTNGQRSPPDHAGLF